MKYQVGDLFVTEKNICILLTKVDIHGIMHGYAYKKTGEEYEYPFGYTKQVGERMKELRWKHYPVVK